MTRDEAANLHRELCELIEAYAPNRDEHTGLPVGSEVEQLAALIRGAAEPFFAQGLPSPPLGEGEVAALKQRIADAMASFTADPPDSDYQRGFLAALEELAR